MCRISVGSNSGPGRPPPRDPRRSAPGRRRIAARRGEGLGGEPVHRHVVRGHRHGGNEEGVEREADRRGAAAAQEGVVVSAAMAEASAAPVEGEAGHDDEVERAPADPARMRRLRDAERAGGRRGARREPGEAVAAQGGVPRRDGDAPAGAPAGREDPRRRGLPRCGEVERDRAGAVEHRQADEPRRGAGGARGEPARGQGLAEPAHAAAQGRLARQDGASGVRGAFLRDSQASMRLRIVSS